MDRLMDKAAMKVAYEKGIPKFEVYRIWASQFKIVANTMKKNEFEGVMLPYLGKFIVSMVKLRRINESAAKKRQLQNGIIQRRKLRD